MHWSRHAPIVHQVRPGVFSFKVLSITKLSMSVLSSTGLSITHVKSSSHYYFTGVMRVAVGHQADCIEVIIVQYHSTQYLSTQYQSAEYHFIVVIWVAAGFIEVIMHQLCTRSGQVCPVLKCSVSHMWMAISQYHCSVIWVTWQFVLKSYVPFAHQIWPGTLKFKTLISQNSVSQYPVSKCSVHIWRSAFSIVSSSWYK